MWNRSGVVLAALMAAGCRTSPPEQVVMTEVSLTGARPFAVAQAPVDTNAPGPAKAPTNCPPPAVSTNVPPRPRLVLPTNGWVALQIWSQAHGLGQPRKIAFETYAVATPRGQAVFQPGSQCMRWEGMNVWLGFAPRYFQGEPHLHALDVHKTLEPLVGPGSNTRSAGRVVMIDPGHGGTDGGTQGSRQQLEKNLALDWALRLRPLLQSNGWEVHLTRTNDVEMSLQERVARADQVKAGFFLSLHFNGLSADSRHGGVETFCTTPAGLPSSVRRNGEDNPALVFPNNTYDVENLRFASRLHREVLVRTRAADGGVRRARFIAVLRAQRRPSVLIEGGFLSNPEEARRIATPAYRQTLAEAVATAFGRAPRGDSKAGGADQSSRN